MFFQINITPKEKKKKAAECDTPAEINKSYNLLLAPFQPPTRIKLDAHVNSSVECQLTIRNSNNRHLTVSVTKVPPDERCLKLSATEWSIQPESSVVLSITWQPKEEGSWRDVLQLSDSRRIKYDVPLILTSTNTNKEIQKQKKKAPAANKKALANKQATTKRTRCAPIADNKENRSQNIGLDWMLNQAQIKRQRRMESPPRALDFSKYLDSSAFKFTPLKSKFAEALPVSPQNVESKGEMVLRKETYITIPKFPNVAGIKSENEKNEFDDSLSPPAKSTAEISALLGDIKFTPFKSLNAKTRDDLKSIKRASSPFSDDESSSKNATFDIENKSFELSCESPTSTRRTCHLKPSYLAREFDKINLEFSTPLQFSKSQLDCGSARDCLEADLWVKSKNTSLSPISKSLINSTLKSIREEDGNDQVLAEKPNAMCIEFSPPPPPPPRKPGGNLKLSVMKRISPTKTGKLLVLGRKEERVLKNKMRGASTQKVAQIPGVRITKLSLSKQLSSSNGGDVGRMKKEPSVKLHDPNDFLTMFCNPDPFAATMTRDPFLTASLYYDDKFIFVQELEFKKWLNALLTPPEHLSADVESTAIDVGKVWQCCRTTKQESIVLAETRESVSARYHSTNTRLNTLRKAACAMFRKAEVIGPLSRTTVGIEKEILVIRPDKDLHRDIGLQKTILELFISYNPLWLRIGLETIYGETIPLQSNNDLIGLSRFLLSRFFSDPFIVKQHSASSHPNIRLASFQPLINKFMLKKFLFLVYFLDHAKRMKLIGHDPCLFHKKAALKDSRSILLAFARELLSGIGDVTKVLRHYGYTVSHKQTHLDEYDYAVTSLSTDLRDGVRLCRLMELVTGRREGLTDRCRVPAISRLQKVHNVGVALTALAHAGYAIAGDIQPKCIADGHREKTLSLLWQIIYRFQRPRFERAASRLQRWWRARMWLPRLRRLLARRRDDAARVLQRAWRRRQRRLLERRRDEAARLLQRQWRRRRELLRRRTAALRLQTWWRRLRAIRPHVRELARRRQLVVSLQRRWRAALERRRFLRLRKWAVLLQTRWRFARKLRAARRLQARWRATLLGRRQRADYLRLRAGALAVQARWRGRWARRRFLELRRACLRAQALWRGRRVRERLERLRWAVRTVERRREATLATRRARFAYLSLQRAATRIQASWRARWQRRRYLALRSAVLVLQRRWRGLLQRRRLARLRGAVRLVEERREATLFARRKRREYLRLGRTALCLQRRWRALRQERRRRTAAVLLQAHWRGWLARRRLLQLRSASLLVQTRWRFARLRRAVVRVQTRWRARQQRRRYLAQRSAALRLQRRWRETLVERRMARLRRAVRIVEERRQATLIGRRTHRHYLRLRWAALRLQRRWRARRRERAATSIQRRWRSLLAGRRARAEYHQLKAATRLIERWWIGSGERRAERARAHRRAAAALKIQSVWRGFAVRRAASKQLAVLRSRAERAAKAAVPTATLAFRLEDSIEKFKYASNIGQLSVSLASLDLLVRLLPNACVQVCQLNLVSKLYDILTQANRSLPWLDVCLKDVSILLTLAKFKPTTEYVLKLEYVQVLARILTISSDKKEDLFLHTATLMWVLTESEEYAEAAKDCPRTKYLLQSLCTSRISGRRFGSGSSKSTRLYAIQDVLPSPNPDWGLRNKRPRIFNSVSQAVISLAARLNILNPAPLDMQRSFNLSSIHS